MKLSKNILNLRQRFIEERRGEQPLFLLLDSQSYLQFCLEFQIEKDSMGILRWNPSGCEFSDKAALAVYDRFDYLPLMYFCSMRIVVVPQIPELCAVIGDPWIEARRAH